MLRPAVRREVADHLQEPYGISERRACQVTGFGRSSLRYRKRSDPQVALRMRLKELAAARVRYGDRRLQNLLRREGRKVNHKRTYRIYRDQGLSIRPKLPKRKRAGRYRQGRPAIGELIVLDTLSRVLAGGDENLSVDMGALVRNVDRLREATGAHLALVHHTGKDKARGARGHSLLRAATDTELEVADGKLKATKQRDIEGGFALGFRLESLSVGSAPDGQEVRSAVVE